MKTCPFCKENILDDAIKCRYCQSMLVSAKGENAGKTDRATYIVDRGIIRYGKFTLAILAIFAFVGVVLFGVNLEETYDRMRATEKEIERIAKKMEQAEIELIAAQARLVDTNLLANEILADVQQALGEARQKGARITEEIKQLSVAVRQTLGKGVVVESRELSAGVAEKAEVPRAGSTVAPAADSRAQPRESN